MNRNIYLAMAKRYRELAKMGRGGCIELWEKKNKRKLDNAKKIDAYQALDMVFEDEFGKILVDEFYNAYLIEEG